MARSRRITNTVALAAFLIHGSAGAVNLFWLDTAPVRHFSDKDWEMATRAADEALASRKDGETVAWKNAESGHSGEVMVTRTLQRDGRSCRNLAIENRAGGKSGSSEFLFCVQPDGQWKIESGAATGRQ